MLLHSTNMHNIPVMSLQTGTELARTAEAIIDPATLDIVAYRLHGSRLEQHSPLLLSRDIREIGTLGVIIDSSDELIDEEDVIKIKELSKLNFRLINLIVNDTLGHTLGKIYDYTFDIHTLAIQQLTVKRTVLGIQTNELLINRSQIIEINNSAVIVDAATLDQKPVPAVKDQSFVNPFRKPTVSGGNTSSKELS